MTYRSSCENDTWWKIWRDAHKHSSSLTHRLSKNLFSGMQFNWVSPFRRKYQKVLQVFQQIPNPDSGTNMSVFGLWEETLVPETVHRGTRRKHWKAQYRFKSWQQFENTLNYIHLLLVTILENSTVITSKSWHFSKWVCGVSVFHWLKTFATNYLSQ